MISSKKLQALSDVAAGIYWTFVLNLEPSYRSARGCLLIVLLWSKEVARLQHVGVSCICSRGATRLELLCDLPAGLVLVAIADSPC